MPSVTLTKIQKDADGKVRIRFGKREYEFANIQAVRDFARGQLDRDTLEAITMALALTRQPTLSNPTALEGRTLTVDFTLANWGTVT